MVHRHILLLAFPSQGSLNPTLQLAKNLAKIGVKVTILASRFVERRMTSSNYASPATEGLTFAYFSDGFDDGIKLSGDINRFRAEFKRSSCEAMAEIITASRNEGHPITCLVYNMLLVWAPALAREFNIPSAPLWVQPAAIFDVYFHYFNGYGEEIRKISDNKDSTGLVIELPGLPPLTRRDLPTYMLPSKLVNPFALPAFKEQLEVLDAEAKKKKPIVLVNTFDSLEEEALRAIEKYRLVAVGPLVPQAFLDGEDHSSDADYGCDLVQSSKGGVIGEWLDAKERSSVVYVAFGSFLGVSDLQMEEIARGLIESNRPFLWVIKDTESHKLSWREEVERHGKIVPWCSQLEVLWHASVGCFVTHCGWNSSLETLVCGVPIVGLSIFTDQPMNAKLLEDTAKVGVRLTLNEQGVAQGDEVKRCIEVVMGEGEKGKEVRRNARKWKDLAKEATKEGGSSYVNLRAFVDEVQGDL